MTYPSTLVATVVWDYLALVGSLKQPRSPANPRVAQADPEWIDQTSRMPGRGQTSTPWDPAGLSPKQGSVLPITYSSLWDVDQVAVKSNA